MKKYDLVRYGTLYVNDSYSEMIYENDETKWEFDIKIQDALKEHYLVKDGIVSFWVKNVSELISFILTYPSKFVSKIKLLDKLTKVERVLNDKIIYVKDDKIIYVKDNTIYITLVNKVKEIKHCVVMTNNGLTKDDINFLNDIVKKYGIKI